MQPIYPQNKIHTIESAIQWREELRKAGQTLSMTNGCFDILHRGHIDYLYKARAFGDKLMLLVNSDNSVRSLKGPDRPINKEQDRAFVLAGLGCIDAVLIFDSVRCDDVMKLIKADIYAKGGDYTYDTIDRDERAALESVNTEIKFIPFVDGFSTTATLEKTLNNG